MKRVNMMGFITHCCKSVFEQMTQQIYGWLRLCVLCLLAFSNAWAQTPVLELIELRVERIDTSIVLSSNVRLELGPSVEDALLKGITLYFVTEVEIRQERWYFYNQRVSYAERHVRLFYQPLTRRWRVNISPQAFNVSGLGVSLGQSYDTAEDAINAVRRIAQWRIANATDYNPDAKQTISINFKLDLKQLPRPMQIGLAGQSDWNIGYNKTQRLELKP
jgi:hypothetical protein